MGKKKASGKHYVSKGIHSNVSVDTVKGVRRNRPLGTDLQNKMKAWRAGKNPWVTIANPNPNQTNKRFIRVAANKLWGDWRDKYGMMKDKDKKVETVEDDA